MREAWEGAGPILACSTYLNNLPLNPGRMNSGPIPFSMTMPQRLRRLLIFWFVIALQAMTPFIHVHAGALPAGHTSLLHMHPYAYSDAGCHAVSPDEHGPEIEMAQGSPLRHATLAVADAVPHLAPPDRLTLAAVCRPIAGVPIFFPLLPLPPPDHTLPPALAPPLL